MDGHEIRWHRKGIDATFQRSNVEVKLLRYLGIITTNDLEVCPKLETEYQLAVIHF